ncbi:MAG: ABC transporter ATP-binding protein [Chloroflexi bacterium]|nr:ABC transporter ATP-binding protein [Chloroflexota bacterium]
MIKLKGDHLEKHFGGLAALAGVTLEVVAGERRAIIGPNGAGKTTLFNLLSGELHPTRGRIFLDDREVTRLPVHERANLGLARTFQRNNLFLELTTFENVRLAAQHRRRVASRLFRPTDSYPGVAEEAGALLAQVGLSEEGRLPAHALSYGQQRALEMALALGTHPNVLLLDEPTAGMSPAETAGMVELIQALPASLTLLIVEHDMDVIFTLADRITVLHYGLVISDGTPEEVRADPTVQEIYLGAA